MNYIALSTMCKENLSDIIEWIEYHSAIGVDHFIVYNNDISLDLVSLIPQNLKQITSVIPWDYNFSGRQIYSQEHCIKHYSEFRWIGFLDIDEYIVLLNNSTDIKQYLKNYEEYGGIGLHWLMFGSNNLMIKQSSTIYSYTQSCPSHGANIHIKSIINPKEYTGSHSDPHFIGTKNGNVNVNKEIIYDAFGNIRGTNKKPIIDINMRINHYYTKSLEDFNAKKNRGGGNMVDRIYTDTHFSSVQNENIYNDDIIRLYNRIKNEHPDRT